MRVWGGFFQVKCWFLGIALVVCFSGNSFASEWYNLPFLSNVSGTDVSGTKVRDAVGGTEVKVAGLRFLDKQNNRVKDLSAEADKDITGLPLQIRMRRCVRDVAGVAGQDMAWLEVRDPANKGAVLFEGWMINLYPDMATLENPRFDLRLVGCARPKSAKGAPTAPSIRVDGAGGDDEAPDGAAAPAAPDEEAPAASPSAAGSNGKEEAVKASPAEKDPYYVPGVESGGKPAGKTKIADPAPAGDQQDLQKMMDEGTY